MKIIQMLASFIAASLSALPAEPAPSSKEPVVVEACTALNALFAANTETIKRFELLCNSNGDAVLRHYRKSGGSGTIRFHILDVKLLRDESKQALDLQCSGEFRCAIRHENMGPDDGAYYVCGLLLEARDADSLQKIYAGLLAYQDSIRSAGKKPAPLGRQIRCDK